MLRRAKPNVLFRIETDVAALIIADHLRMDVRRERHVDRVEVGDPTHGRRFAARGQVRWQMRREDAFFGDFNFFESEFSQFLREEFGKTALAFGARHDARLGVALRGHGDVTQKAFKKLFLHCVLSFFSVKQCKKRLPST